MSARQKILLMPFILAALAAKNISLDTSTVTSTIDPVKETPPENESRQVRRARERAEKKGCRS